MTGLAGPFPVPLLTPLYRQHCRRTLESHGLLHHVTHHQERFEAEKQQNILERAKLGPEIYDIGEEIERTKEACKEEDLKKDEIWDRLAIKVRDRRLKEEKIVEVEVQLKSLPPQ